MLLKLRTLCVVSVVQNGNTNTRILPSVYLVPVRNLWSLFLLTRSALSHMFQNKICFVLGATSTSTSYSNQVCAFYPVTILFLSYFIEVRILNTSETSESAVLLALNKTALPMCRRIQSDHAVLFPHLYALFLSYLPSNVDNSVSISKHRLLSFLGSEFGDLVSSYCHNKKVGTVFHK